MILIEKLIIKFKFVLFNKYVRLKYRIHCFINPIKNFIERKIIIFKLAYKGYDIGTCYNIHKRFMKIQIIRKRKIIRKIQLKNYESMQKISEDYGVPLNVVRGFFEI